MSGKAAVVKVKVDTVKAAGGGLGKERVLSPYLVSQVQHAHLGILHLEDTVFQQELAAQVIQVGCSHWVHSLAGKKQTVLGVSCLLTAHWASPGLYPQAQLALRVWKYCSVSFS